jgi:hypothetical protein
MLWLGALVGYGIIVYYLARILLVSRSRIAMWFSASLVVTAIAGFAEVIKAMFGLPGPVPYVNSVTAALSSGLLVAMALAEQMRHGTVRAAGRGTGAAEDLRPGSRFLLHRRRRPGAFCAATRRSVACSDSVRLKASCAGRRSSKPGTWESLVAALANNARAQLRFQSADHRLVRGTELDRRRPDRGVDRGHHRSRHGQPQADVPGRPRPADRSVEPSRHRAGAARRDPRRRGTDADDPGIYGPGPLQDHQRSVRTHYRRRGIAAGVQQNRDFARW